MYSKISGINGDLIIWANRFDKLPKQIRLECRCYKLLDFDVLSRERYNKHLLVDSFKAILSWLYWKVYYLLKTSGKSKKNQRGSKIITFSVIISRIFMNIHIKRRQLRWHTINFPSNEFSDKKKTVQPQTSWPSYDEFWVFEIKRQLM